MLFTNMQTTDELVIIVEKHDVKLLLENNFCWWNSNFITLYFSTFDIIIPTQT